MELWGANHPNYSVISTLTMSFITPFGWCGMHTSFLQCIIHLFTLDCIVQYNYLCIMI